MRRAPRGWWLGGSCGFVLQLRYVDPKVDVFLVQIATGADRFVLFMWQEDSPSITVRDATIAGLESIKEGKGYGGSVPASH